MPLHYTSFPFQPKLKTAFYTYATNYDKLGELLCNKDIVPWGKQKIIFAGRSLYITYIDNVCTRLVELSKITARKW